MPKLLSLVHVGRNLAPQTSRLVSIETNNINLESTLRDVTPQIAFLRITLSNRKICAALISSSLILLSLLYKCAQIVFSDSHDFTVACKYLLKLINSI